MPSFWTGLSTGEKFALPLLLLALVAVSASIALFDISGGIWPPFLLILIIWTIWRGKKNSDESNV